MEKPTEYKTCDDEELLSRFLFYNKQINRTARCIKTSALKGTPDVGFSVFKTTGLPHIRIWYLGKKRAAPGYESQGKPMLGRFDLEARIYKSANLKIIKSPPERHYNIYGMPISTDIDQAHNLSKRQIVANAVQLYLLEENDNWKCFQEIQNS